MVVSRETRGRRRDRGARTNKGADRGIRFVWRCQQAVLCRGDDESARRVADPRARGGVARRGVERRARDSARESSSRDATRARSRPSPWADLGKTEARTYQGDHRGMLPPRRGEGWLVHSHRDGLVPHVRAFAIARASAVRVSDSSAPRPTEPHVPAGPPLLGFQGLRPPRTQNYSRTTLRPRPAV